LHASNPTGVRMLVRTDTELCAACHQRDDVRNVYAADGFILQNQQYNEILQSKHAVLKCIDCHDPHSGGVRLAQAQQPTTRTDCTNCHTQEAQYQNNPKHVAMQIQCVSCHMPYIDISAQGDPAKLSADLRTHLMAINPTQIDQFTSITGADGKPQTVSKPDIGLDAACRHCHVQGTSLAMDDQTLVDGAYNYHAKPSEPPKLPTATPTP